MSAKTGMISLAAWSITLAGIVAGAEGPIAARAPRPSGGCACLMASGQTLVLRVRQVIPCDGLSPGERLLNGRQLLVAGDRFLAEVIAGPRASQVWVGGIITRVVPPGRFQRAGHIEVTMTQLVQYREGTSSPVAWHVDMDDRRFGPRMHRALLATLFGFDESMIGASVGSQLAQSNPAFIGGGAGIGLAVGLGTAALQRGPEASLDPGDTFQVQLGTCSYRPLPRTPSLVVYPPRVPLRK